MPPVNDDFASRIVLTGASGSTTGSNVGATMETGEPAQYAGSGTETVWWEWTAPASGDVEWDTFGSTEPGGSQLDTVLDVWTGSSLATLSLVAGSDDAGSGVNSQAIFTAVAGTTYYIRVYGYGVGYTGDIILSWGPYTPPPVPAITSASPNPAAYNAIITITGTDLAGVTQVYWDLTSIGFGYWSAAPLTTSPTSLTVHVPVSGHDGTWPMFVQDPVGGNSNTIPFTVTTPAPTISSLTPNHALSPSSANIVIAGANLTGATAVNFGGAAAFGYTVDSDSQITAAIPFATQPAGSTVAVTVTTPGGISGGLPFTYDYHTPLLLLDVRSPDPAGIPWMVLRGCEFTIEVQYPDEVQAVRIGAVDCPDFYVEPHPGGDLGFVHVKVPLTVPLSGHQDVTVLDGTGAWNSWHASSPWGINSPSLFVLDETDDPFLVVQQALTPAGGSSGSNDFNWPNANGMGLFELDVDPVVTQRHLMAGFTHPDTPSNPSIYSDIKLQTAVYFSPFDRISLGVTANNQDGLAVGAVGDSWTDLAGGNWRTFAVVAYHVDSGFSAVQQFQLVRIQRFFSDSIAPVGAPVAGDSGFHGWGMAVVPLSGQRFMVVDSNFAVGGGTRVRCKTYSVDLTTGAMTLLDSADLVTSTTSPSMEDVWPIDGSRALILRSDGELFVASVDSAGLVTYGATTNVVPAADGLGVTVCPDGAGGFWTLASIGQLLDHYSVSGTTITRDSRVSVVSDDGTNVGGFIITQTSDRGDVLLVIGGGHAYFNGGPAWVVETANGHAGPMWGWGSGPGVGDMGSGHNSRQPRPAINLLGTTGRTQLVWVPTAAITPGDTEYIQWATYEIDEFLQPCTPFVRPGGWVQGLSPW